jgi:glutathione peroxidase
MRTLLAIGIAAVWMIAGVCVNGEAAMTNIYDFLGQEPGKEAEIKNFCTLTYGVDFPMFAKISVKGKHIHPLYAFLTSKETNPNFGGAIFWNFNKFLIGRDGTIVGRFGSRTKPDDKELIAEVERALQQP